MSLRSRLILAVAAALAISLLFGCGLAGWRARRSVLAELTAALQSGAQILRAGLDEALSSGNPSVEARRLVATFDGNRHARASLLNATGAEVERSRLMKPKTEIPTWFQALIAPNVAPIDIAVSVGSDRIVVRLTADAKNEVGEVWGQFRDVAAAFAAFCALATTLGAWTVKRALRPIDNLAGGFARVGAGDYAARVGEDGPSELADLARGFNRMAGRLAETQAENARMAEHLLTLQEEERADLARDLHDEIGPSLFAVNLTAATIGHLAASGRLSEISAHARAVQDVAVQMQRCVKSILIRLRPSRAIEFGLRPAIDELVEFWRGRSSQIAFTVVVSADETGIDDSLKETVYRVVQEGLLNAVRHGQPRRIEIAVTNAPHSLIVEVSDDGALPDTLARPGFGLSGMRERVAALDGTLCVGPSDRVRGWRVTAQMPVKAPL